MAGAFVPGHRDGRRADLEARAGHRCPTLLDRAPVPAVTPVVGQVADRLRHHHRLHRGVAATSGSGRIILPTHIPAGAALRRDVAIRLQLACLPSPLAGVRLRVRVRGRAVVPQACGGAGRGHDGWGHRCRCVAAKLLRGRGASLATVPDAGAGAGDFALAAVAVRRRATAQAQVPASPGRGLRRVDAGHRRGHRLSRAGTAGQPDAYRRHRARQCENPRLRRQPRRAGNTPGCFFTGAEGRPRQQEQSVVKQHAACQQRPLASQHEAWQLGGKRPRQRLESQRR